MPDDVSAQDKTARIVALQALQREIQTALHEAAVGTVVDVLVDSASRRQDAELSGRTMGNTVVNFPAPADTPSGERSWIGRTVPVRITRGGPHSLRGEAIWWRPASTGFPENFSGTDRA
jgi:tRNA-2-methylthio-N6-dimethylallyladenosine synthase